MGKYPNSDIHGKYSDFHWNLIKEDIKYKKLYVADIDRLWIEYDFFRCAVVGVFDIKYEDTSDTLTPTEKGIYEWFQSKNVRVFLVYISRDFERFRVINETGNEIILDKIQYAEFLLSLRSRDKYIDFITKIRVA